MLLGCFLRCQKRAQNVLICGIQNHFRTSFLKDQSKTSLERPKHQSKTSLGRPKYHNLNVLGTSTGRAKNVSRTGQKRLHDETTWNGICKRQNFKEYLNYHFMLENNIFRKRKSCTKLYQQEISQKKRRTNTIFD